jgi:hypothetical protein
MGVVILSADANPYRTGTVIESNEITNPPTKDKTTYIYHVRKITEKEILRWQEVVEYRLVFVIDKLPKITPKTKDSIIIDKSLIVRKSDFKREVGAMLNWGNREQAAKYIERLPTPLALSFLRENRRDIDLWRLLSDCVFVLPDEYAKAILSYGVEAGRGIRWPKRKTTAKERPHGFRESDVYWEQLLECSAKVRNDVRDTGKVPKGVKKTKESILEWI